MTWNFVEIYLSKFRVFFNEFFFHQSKGKRGTLDHVFQNFPSLRLHKKVCWEEKIFSSKIFFCFFSWRENLMHLKKLQAIELLSTVLFFLTILVCWRNSIVFMLGNQNGKNILISNHCQIWLLFFEKNFFRIHKETHLYFRICYLEISTISILLDFKMPSLSSFPS